MSRKIVSLLIVLTLVLSAAIIPTAVADSPYELNMMWCGNDNSDRSDAVCAAIGDYLTEKLGTPVSMNFYVYGWDVTTTALPALQAGEKIDIFFTAGWLYYSTCVAQGLFLPMNDLLQSDGQDILANLNPLFLEGAAVDGVNYAVPTNKELAVPWGWFVNMAAAEEIGLTEEAIADIHTCEQMEEYLAAYKALHSEFYPYVIGDASWPDSQWYPVDQLGTGTSVYLLSQKNLYEADGSYDDTVYSVFEDESTIAHMALMHDWLKAGYIDPENSLDSHDHNDVFTTGNWLFMTMPLKGNGIKAAEMIQQYGNEAMKAALNAGETPVVEIYTSFPKLASEFIGSMLAIPITCEKPELAMQFINLMHSDQQLINMMLYGIEGDDWYLNDEGFVEFNNNSWFSGHGGAWTMGNTGMQYVTVGEDPEKNAKLISFADDAITLPSTGFTFDTVPVETQLAAIKNVVEKYQRGLVFGLSDPEDPDMGIAAYVADLKAAGLETVQAEYTAQYAAWIAEKAAE